VERARVLLAELEHERSGHESVKLERDEAHKALASVREDNTDLQIRLKQAGDR
jgi:hypothetical protein